MTAGEACLVREQILRDLEQLIGRVSLWGPGGVGRLDGPQVKASIVDAVKRYRTGTVMRDPWSGALLQIRASAEKQGLCPAEMLTAWPLGVARLREALEHAEEA